AIANFTKAHNFRLVIAFHTQGEVIYWGYEGLEPPESQNIVKTFSEASGYQPIRYVDSNAGYKDWFIQDWRRPGFTVECGLGKSPLPVSQFWQIWSKNIGILLSGLVV
ncbi:MAG: peptidase M14, partial [Eubacteriales bacterium]